MSIDGFLINSVMSVEMCDFNNIIIFTESVCVSDGFWISGWKAWNGRDGLWSTCKDLYTLTHDLIMFNIE